MLKRLAALALCLMIAICLFPPTGQVSAAALDNEDIESTACDPALFAEATFIDRCNTEYDWTISNQLWDDQGMPVGIFQDKYYTFIPNETKVYPIISRPDLYDTYLVLYSANADGEIIQLDVPTSEIEQSNGVWDYILEPELTAGQTYYIRVSSIEGGDGIITVLEEAEDQEQPDSATGPQTASLTTKVGEAGYSFGGETKTMAACYLKNDDTMMPIRMLQDLGVSFAWNSATQTATMVFGENTVRLTVGSSEALVNGETAAIVGASGNPVAPELAPGRTMIPLRFVSQQLGFRVKWEPGHLITITR